MTSELFTVRSPAAALAELSARAVPVGDVDDVATRAALGRILARAIVAEETLPAFDRATMDGYAVRACETAGASDTSPAYLRVSGEVTMGAVAAHELTAGCAIRIHTGAMLPPGADAVVIVEETNLLGTELEVLRAVGPGENTLAAGDDVRAGEPVLAPGRRLRTADLGALHALGIARVEVFRRPRVAVLSTGDELVEAGTSVVPLGAIRDANGATLAAIVEAAGGVALDAGIVRDDPELLVARMRAALEGADALVLSAGSSVSARDFTAAAIERLGPPGVFVHGIALRPGKPTILAFAGTKPVVGLPGNPVSAALVARRLVAPLTARLGGAVAAPFERMAGTVRATLAASVPSRPGREEYVPCRLSAAENGTLLATPLFGSSSLLFNLVRADGAIVVPFDRAGVATGERIDAIVL